MKLISSITTYDFRWPKQYQDEATRLISAFGSASVEIHHVGSTAVPGLSAKPEIDLLVVVDDISSASAWTNSLSALGYRRGRDLSQGHLFYKRDLEEIRTHKIHVCLAGHAKIDEMLKFRDHLRSHDEARDAYEALKTKLEQGNTAGIGEYLQGKEPFIRAVLTAIKSE